MKLFFQSIFFSLIVHILYFVGAFVYTWFATILYKPDIIYAYDSVAFLQSEVNFGSINQGPIPGIFFVSFFVVALAGAFFIYITKKYILTSRSV
ncbi:hypothetical protein AJ85_04260 [Alkalihalobacillus alcalophilus ATCC 27647 = CGMCC 1.3604]|uniref:Uncharacterized protein n=1 Tax=Alkalihalobacillus alcalophilus ATCC 27647 = CGMCC 1.3604 TaxID=1218173 RepID=A0A094XJ95_ALKAL|nr:hypothetical protein [Alkalihalobacillus alcalophilus]KGA98815.1 hypothetical protein BALCAV_0202625 [Alkalihalobacillus alcalophilus ATCC 27647 = CGMCC 1.3604]MED1560998.1 hypothetical protein [Alkalihalobacillus alcalophilus]THG91556.1 hypothetical protein AJ85_04260 [Alkalihalobacillus alcalophilus ATCC 27647 = CGMCC 1.3604]